MLSLVVLVLVPLLLAATTDAESGKPCGSKFPASAGMPKTPYSGNGDLGAAVDGSGSCGEIQINLGLNQMWMINNYKHWPGPRGDDVAPRRIGFGGVTIRAAPGAFAAAMDMSEAKLYVTLGSLSVTLTLSEGEAIGSTMAIRLNNTNSSAPMDIEVISWVMDVGSTLCGPKHVPPECNTMDGFVKYGASTSTGSFAVRSPFKAWVYKPVMAALAVNSEHNASRCNANRNGTDDWGGASCTYVLAPGGALPLLASVVTNLDLCDTVEGCSDPLAAAQSRVANVSSTNIAGVESAHAAFWQNSGAQSSVTLPQSPDVEDYWRSAQYLLGSASRKGSVATGLWGPWVFTDQSGWQGDFTLDYNYMASYWATYSSNHVELAFPYYVPLIDYYPHGMRSAAAKSCSGLSLPAHIGPWGSAGSTGDAWQGTGAGDWGQNMDGVFSATLFVLHWESTHDVAFLRNMGFEFCRDTLALYQCLMNRTQDGGYINLRDTNGECGYQGYFPGGDNPACMLPNVQYVNSFIRRIAAALPSMAKALGVAVDPQWLDIALHQVPLPSTTINGTDKKIYTMCDTNESIPDPDSPQRLSGQQKLQSSGGTGSMPSLAWCKDPGLNPWTIHPGDGVNLGDGPAVLEMARRGFGNISEVVGMNNFCSSFNAAVRIGMPVADVLAGFRASTQPCGKKKAEAISPNVDYHPPPPPAPTTCKLPNGIVFQNGGVEMAGAAEFVNSMLMQSVTAHDGSGKVTSMVFPVWDKQQDASFSNLRARGAFLISANFSAKIQQVVSPVTIKSEAGQLCRLISPWKGEPRNRVEVRDATTGQTVPVEWEANPSGDDILDFETTEGQSYRVSLVGQ